MSNMREYEEWLNTCKWIHKEMYFRNFEDFIHDAKVLKRMYKRLTPLGVMLYRMYVYGRRNISNYRVECIWNYLNDNLSYDKLTKS